jgi:NADPH:quinone reductase-like Zn-dependent oxidoreductase
VTRARELGLTHAEAAVLAGAGRLALRAARLCNAGPRDRVMITGASSDAGALAVQIVKARGGHVTAVCCARDVPLVWDLGADQVLEGAAEGSTRFAAVIDADRSVTPELAAALLDPGGRLVAIDALDGGPDEDDLDELAELVERHGVFPLPR